MSIRELTEAHREGDEDPDPDTHETDDECIAAEDYLINFNGYENEGEVLIEHYTCPTCGRDWGMHYARVDLYNPRTEEVQYEF